ASSSGTATFSSAVMLGMRWKDWNTMPMLRPRKAAISSSLLPFSVMPAMVTRPASTRSSPARTMSSVDFPEPEGPTMPAISPCRTVRSIPFSTWTEDAPSPSVSDTFSSSMTAFVKTDRSYMEGRAKARMQASCGNVSTYGGKSMAFKYKFLCPVMVLGAMLFGVALSLAAPARSEPVQIVGFGDSLMAGFGLGPGEGFTEQLQEALRAKGHDVTVSNAGVSGDTTS